MILVAWDTDRIKSYVFATSKLREIRGASAILDDLNLNEIPRIVGEDRIIYAGGGSAMAIVNDKEEAEELIRQVAQLYRSRTQSAEITGAWIDISDSNILFGEYARRLKYLLRVRKDEKVRLRSWRTSPVLKVCASCGQYPAEHQDTKPKEVFICSSCSEKRRISQQIRNGRDGSLLTQLLTYAQAKKQWLGASIGKNAPEDFTEIGEVASPKGYIGFIYCDGNRMGEILSKLPTPEAFKNVSIGIRDTLREALFDVLCDHFRDLRSQRGWVLPSLRDFKESKTRDDSLQSQVLPFEIIFVGGDDLVLVVAADMAIEIAHYLCREFGHRTAQVLKQANLVASKQNDIKAERLSLSVAVVFAHASLPIYYLQAVADDLLNSAKRRSLNLLEEQGTEVGCVDFHVVTASSTELPSSMRKADWVRSKGALTLTERPYTADELYTLILRIRALKATNFPTSKLQMLYEAIVDHSKTQAMFIWAFVAGRTKRKDQFERLIDFFQPFSGPLVWPWRERKAGKSTTPMLDVAELYDFIKTVSEEQLKEKQEKSERNDRRS